MPKDIQLARRIRGKLEEELKQMKEVAHEAETMNLLSNFKKRVHELEAEVANRRLIESRIFDSLASQTRKFEQTKIELEESKVEISLLHEEIESLVASSEQNSWRCDGSCSAKIALEKELGCLRFELGLAKVNLAKIQERERFASSKAKALSDEIHLVKNELKFATYAEEKSQKALDDLALVLKEVAAEAYEAKEKLNASQLELEQVKDETGQLKHMVRNAEARYQKLLNESRLAQDEVVILAESLKAAERMTRAAKREVYKLKCILKQAINEVDAAKTAAGLTRDENIQLKDSNTEKEESIRVLTQENERLGFISSSALKTKDKEKEEEHYDDSQIKKTSSLDISVNLRQEQVNLEVKIHDELAQDESATFAESVNESPKQVSHHRGAYSFAFSEDKGTPKSKDLCMTLSKSSSSFNTEYTEQQEERYSELKLQQEDLNAKIQNKDPEKAEGSIIESPKIEESIKRKRTLFRKVVDLIKRKSFRKTIH